MIVQLFPTIEFPPKMRRIVKEFFRVMSERTNRYFAGRYLPIRIELASNQTEILVRKARE